MRKWAAVVAAGWMAAGAWGQEDKPMQPAEAPAAKPAAPQPAAAEPKQTENLPAAEELFEKHIAAIGGVEQMRAERNRLVRGKYTTGKGDQGVIRVMRVAPNKMSQLLEIPGLVTEEKWFDGENGWVRDTNSPTGTRKLQGAELAEQRRQADILGECNYKVRYKEIKTVARERFAGSEAFAVRAVPAEGKDRILYFSAASGLLVGIRMPGEHGSASDIVTELSDYKKFGETLHPAKSVMKLGDHELGSVTITQIESNLSAMPSVDPPDDVRAIK